MSDTDSSRVNWPLAYAWVVFAAVNAYLTFLWAGAETIPYHLIWASFAFLYGLYPWPRRLAWVTFWVITVVTGVAFAEHSLTREIAWTECSEIVLMGVILALLMWHVERQRATRATLVRLQQQEMESAHSRELRSKFGTHEVRTRLTIARGFVELIVAAKPGRAIEADAELVIAELDKASSLVTSLLTLATVSESSVRMTVDVKLLIDAVLHRWISSADRQWSSATLPGTVEADAERLEVALDCLLENAVKFTEPGDSIEITCEVDGGMLVLSVADSGAGIPEADLGRIFEMFKTSSTAGDRAGSGLGLPIVKAIAEAGMGSVTVRSAVGEGSCFIVRMRLTDRALESSAAVASRPAPAEIEQWAF
ncbi:HAMP domain-containing sensor histidine kinase [Nakamurella sp. PAMC28650]|jgi:two-component system OmpR family sensor kinase|uniref:sensor histidine kinase n=1 Tax=Nakamurella sp. PAMC28650 TaxID=2762325 RepID=UPI00164E0547|nr:HAMP domain-containing sensor histidine kinase [Nakamurella sp. PAMC28650]QNK79428.1 HAMP domain-containing histidine kinase [Nakamurella sp. PAMC28650]